MVSILRFFYIFSFFLSANVYANNSMISIHSPHFRKLVVASPEFKVGFKSKKLTDLQERSSEEIDRLLEFTGFFRVMPREIFKRKKALEKVDEMPFWRALGVDTVVLGTFHPSKVGFALHVEGLDVYRQKRLYKKVYTIKNPSDLTRALKKYVDYLLQAYTGKPGIYDSKIVFAGRKTKSSDREIFICNPDGTNLQQITKKNTIHISPSWHPNGERIVFTSYEMGRPNLYQYDLKTKTKMRIQGPEIKRGVLNSGGKFSPFGSVLAYTQIKESSKSQRSSTDIFYISSPDGNFQKGLQRLLVRGDGIDVDPIFSPDGKWLAYVSGRYGNPHIFKAELDWNAGKTEVKIKNETRLTFAGWWNAMPTWSPDSEKIAFAGFDREINRFDLFIMNNNGSLLERLTLESGDNKSPSFSPNGNLIIFHSNRVGNDYDRGRNQLYIMNQDGSEQRVIETGLYDAEDPKWGPYMGEMQINLSFAR